MFTDGVWSGQHTLNKKVPADRQPKPGNNLIWFLYDSKDLSLCYYFKAGTKKDYAAICRPMQPYARSLKQSTLAVTSMQEVVLCGKITPPFLRFSSDRLQSKCSLSVLCADQIVNGLFVWPLYLFQTVSVPAKHIVFILFFFSYNQQVTHNLSGRGGILSHHRLATSSQVLNSVGRQMQYVGPHESHQIKVD